MSVNKPLGLFITGTDTGVGKTQVASALAKLLTDRGIKVGIMKPAESGVNDPENLGPDGQLLKWAAASTLSDREISPYRLRAALAPSVAASQEKIRIDYSNLLEKSHQIIDKHDFTIIEGAGGLMVPLSGGFLMADFARDLGLPLLVVCRPNLGTINHTLLTLFAARSMDIETAGYIINNMPAEKTAAEDTVAHTLATLTTDELLGILNHVEGNDQEKVNLLTQQLSEMRTLSLLEKHLPSTQK